jgi:hypothetical protein
MNSQVHAAKYIKAAAKSAIDNLIKLDLPPYYDV